MNKYQEALTVVNNFFEWNSTEGMEVKYPFKYDYELVSKSVDTLQELIDKYKKYEEDEMQEYEEWFEQQ